MSSTEELCDGQGRLPAQIMATRQFRPVHGCYRCCQACSLDRHICPGCGKHLKHGIDVCLKCRNSRDFLDAFGLDGGP